MDVRAVIASWSAVSALGGPPMGCANEDDPEPTVAEIIDEEIGETVLEECGTIATDHANCSAETPPDDIAPRLACIVDAWAECRPTRLVIHASTIEGYTNPETWLVLPTESSCELVRYTDWTLDPFGGCRLLRSECAPFDDRYAPGCPWLFPETCTQSEPVLENPGCA
jgi:hypothetical protein